MPLLLLYRMQAMRSTYIFGTFNEAIFGMIIRPLQVYAIEYQHHLPLPIKLNRRHSTESLQHSSDIQLLTFIFTHPLLPPLASQGGSTNLKYSTAACDIICGG